MYYHRARVVGKGPFPITMLWHDRCWPFSEEDAANIAYSHDRKLPGVPPTFSITVVQTATVDQSGWTPELWGTFGWTLGEVS